MRLPRPRRPPRPAPCPQLPDAAFPLRASHQERSCLYAESSYACALRPHRPRRAARPHRRRPCHRGGRRLPRQPASDRFLSGFLGAGLLLHLCASPLCPPSSSRRRGPSLALARSWPRASTTFSSNSKAFPGGTHFCLHTQVRNPSPLARSWPRASTTFSSNSDFIRTRRRAPRSAAFLRPCRPGSLPKALKALFGAEKFL